MVNTSITSNQFPRVDENYYNQFIDYLKNKQFKPNTKLYKHRIIPGHSGGSYDMTHNVIFISYYFHVAAHFVRYVTYRQVGDFKAYSMMLGQTPEEKLQIAQLAGKKGGAANALRMLESRTMFYDPKWQKKFGKKDQGKINVLSGHMDRLNDYLTQNQPDLRSRAGKLGAKAQQDKARAAQTGFYDKTHYVQKFANLKRWGVKIRGEIIPYKRLSPDFINHYLVFGNPEDFSTSARKKKKK